MHPEQAKVQELSSPEECLPPKDGDPRTKRFTMNVPRPREEYMAHRFGRPLSADELSRWGEQGWQFLCVIGEDYPGSATIYMHYFRRRVP